MWKKRLIPEHIEEYKVCDYCGEEITDYSSTSFSPGNKHFHSMYAGGHKGTVKKTCLDLYQEQELKKNHVK